MVDVAAFNPTASWEYFLGGFMLQDDSGYPIYRVNEETARGGLGYHWSGRQVLDNPATLQLSVQEGGWLVRVTGFELTLP